MNSGSWDLQLCSSFSILFWLFQVPGDYIWILGWDYLLLGGKRKSLVFGRDCSHLNIKSSHLWTPDIFPFTYVFIEFFYVFVILVYSSFASMVTCIPKHFILFGAFINGVIFLNFLFWLVHLYLCPFLNWEICLLLSSCKSFFYIFWIYSS